MNPSVLNKSVIMLFSFQLKKSLSYVGVPLKFQVADMKYSLVVCTKVHPHITRIIVIFIKLVISHPQLYYNTMIFKLQVLIYKFCNSSICLSTSPFNFAQSCSLTSSTLSTCDTSHSSSATNLK